MTEVVLLGIHCSAAKQIYCLVADLTTDPKTSLLLSLPWTYCWTISCLSSLSWWTWHTAMPLSLFWVMVDRNHVFNLRNPLKLHSASADDNGTTINNLTSVSTWLNRPRTSGGICFKACTASTVVLTLYLFLNMASWSLKSSSFSSGYLRTAASFVMGVRSEFYSSFNVWMPGCISLSVMCASTVSRTR